jgi:hypothetical protein
VAERGPIGRTSSGRVRGIAALGVNLLSNMVKKHCKQLTTWPLRKEHSVLQQPNLANSLGRPILSDIKRGAKPTKKQDKKPEMKKEEVF